MDTAQQSEEEDDESMDSPKVSFLSLEYPQSWKAQLADLKTYWYLSKEDKHLKSLSLKHLGRSFWRLEICTRNIIIV